MRWWFDKGSFTGVLWVAVFYFNGNSGNESSGYVWFFCFEAYPNLLDLSAFLVFVLPNSVVSSSVGLSDLLSFEN